MAMISIIVPVYKVEKYIKRCVNSILAQTYKDIEIILVDDGSPDNCPEICDEFVEKYNNIHVIHKQNGGLSSARNAGIDCASGEFITFVDSDDWIEADIYEYAIELQQKYNADIVEYGFRYVYDEKEVIEHDSTSSIDFVFEGKEMLSRMYQNNIGGSVLAWNKIYRKNLFEHVRFEIGKIYEDSLIMPKLFFKAKRCVVSNRCGYFYYQGNTDSITHMDFSEKNLQSLFAHSHNREFYRKNNLVDAKLWCDTTYAFALVNMLRKIKYHWGKDKHYYDVKTEYKCNVSCFLNNPYFSWKQKLLILYYYITI